MPGSSKLHGAICTTCWDATRFRSRGLRRWASTRSSTRIIDPAGHSGTRILGRGSCPVGQTPTVRTRYWPRFQICHRPGTMWTSRQVTPVMRLQSTGRLYWYSCWPGNCNSGQQVTAQSGVLTPLAKIERSNESTCYRHCYHCCLPVQHRAYRLLGFAPRFAKHAGLLPGWKQDALVCARHFECIRYVRHQWHDAAGLLDVYLWREERVDSLALAHVEPKR